MADWYESSFGERYVELYAHRDEREASQALRTVLSDQERRTARILDLGTGTGRHLRQLTDEGAEVIGLDLSSVLLGYARRAKADSWLVRADMRYLPLRAKSVDVTVSMFTSYGYFETDAQHRALAAEMARVTRHAIVVDVPNRHRLTQTLVPESRRELADGWATEQRWLETAPPRVCKRITVFDRASGQSIEEYEERVMLFEPDELEDHFRAAGFSREWWRGDYAGSQFSPRESPRMIGRFVRAVGIGAGE